jgi:hypothetical protein
MVCEHEPDHILPFSGFGNRHDAFHRRNIGISEGGAGTGCSPVIAAGKTGNGGANLSSDCFSDVRLERK